MFDDTLILLLVGVSHMNEVPLTRQLEGHGIANIGDGWRNSGSDWMETVRTIAVLLIWNDVFTFFGSSVYS